MPLLIATHNQGKVAEIAALLAASRIACLSLADAGITLEVEENGDSFSANAALKAQQYAAATGLPTLADDSGLEVDALEGRPGVHTARYGGSHLSQPQRNGLLLAELAALPPTTRAARFRCVMALADADGNLLTSSEGVCEGEIARTPAGEGGFGYDPVFWLPERGCTMAEIDSAEKSRISHRGQALRAILPAIVRHLAA
jgi:XTP/dITP diphosphohydrolase